MPTSKNNNPYSKYRFDNNRSLKVRTNITNDDIVDVFGAEVCSMASDVKIKLYDTESVPYGTTVIQDYVYKVNRINEVDNPIVPPSYKGPTYFKPF
jgi:hypothetical protein